MANVRPVGDGRKVGGDRRPGGVSRGPLRPVFDAEAGDTGEFTGILCNDRQSIREANGGDQQITLTDRRVA
jgi:hypothetical protein